MKSKNILLILILIATLVTLFYSMQDGGTSEAYRKEREKERKDKDDYMRNNSESPFADSVALFTGLKYFDIDESFRISANLIPIEEKKTITLATSDGLEKRYLPYAYAEFSLKGEKCRLLILEIMDMGPFRGTLFLAFADATSAKESYGAGRYLDIKKVPGSTSVLLDFNKAYNPYCAYNDNFSCPFPPSENLLKVAIPAGEKVYY
jgi:uncharacterized protein (DUF1684 family)